MQLEPEISFTVLRIECLVIRRYLHDLIVTSNNNETYVAIRMKRKLFKTIESEKVL